MAPDCSKNVSAFGLDAATPPWTVAKSTIGARGNTLTIGPAERRSKRPPGATAVLLLHGLGHDAYLFSLIRSDLRGPA